MGQQSNTAIPSLHDALATTKQAYEREFVAVEERHQQELLAMKMAVEVWIELEAAFQARLTALAHSHQQELAAAEREAVSMVGDLKAECTALERELAAFKQVHSRTSSQQTTRHY